jgi:hypothetical protein
MAAAQAGDAAALARVVSHQRLHLLTELRSLTEARNAMPPSPVVTLLLTAADLHVRADLGVVDAAERLLDPDVLAAMRGQPAGTARGVTDSEPAVGRLTRTAAPPCA